MCVNEIFHRGGNARSQAHTRSLRAAARNKLTGRMETTRRRLSVFFLLSPPDAGVKGRRKKNPLMNKRQSQVAQLLWQQLHANQPFFFLFFGGALCCHL